MDLSEYMRRHVALLGGGAGPHRDREREQPTVSQVLRNQRAELRHLDRAERRQRLAHTLRPMAAVTPPPPAAAASAPVPEPAPGPGTLRRQQLVKWQAERRRLKAAQQAQARRRPPFKAGLLHRPVGAAPTPVPAPLPAAPQPLRRSSRRRPASQPPPAPVSFAPRHAGFRAPPLLPPSTDTANPPPPPHKMSIFSVDLLQNPTEPVPETDPPLKTPPASDRKSLGHLTSPFVTSSRGKGKALPDDLSSYRASPYKSACYFRIQLDEEITRLQNICDEWTAYKENNNLHEDNIDLINLAIGQTQLLINKKFQQFRGLIDRCESQEKREGEGIVNVRDLEGFWDMVYMQVVNLDIRFNKLKASKENNWIEDYEIPIMTKTKPKPKKKIVAKAKNSNSLKNMIQAARMRSKQETTVKENSIEFNGGFFSVVSPARSNLNNSNSKSMRRSLLSLELKKNSPMLTPQNCTAILNASSAGKCLDQNEKIFPIDLNKTSTKSILKTPMSTKKNIKVLFCETDDVLNNENSSITSNGKIENKSPTNSQKKQTSKRKLRKQLAIENSENILENELETRRKTKCRTSLAKKMMSPTIAKEDVNTTEIKILSPLNCNHKPQRKSLKRLSKSPIGLDDSFLKMMRVSIYNMSKAQTNGSSTSHRQSNLIDFNSPIAPVYMTRSATQKFSINPANMN